MRSIGILVFLFIGLLHVFESKLLGKDYQKKNIITALIQKSFLKDGEITNHACKLQTAYDCFVRCDCSKDPTNCKMNTCMYVCFLLTKPTSNCSRNLDKEEMVLSVLMSNNKSYRNSQDYCHQHCPWSAYCDKCPNCKWCWLCSSCSVPNKNCKYCRVCKGVTSSCVKCCGY